MSAGKRKDGEGYQEYRDRLIAERKADQEQRRGIVVYPSWNKVPARRKKPKTRKVK